MASVAKTLRIGGLGEVHVMRDILGLEGKQLRGEGIDLFIHILDQESLTVGGVEGFP